MRTAPRAALGRAVLNNELEMARMLIDRLRWMVTVNERVGSLGEAERARHRV